MSLPLLVPPPLRPRPPQTRPSLTPLLYVPAFTKSHSPRSSLRKLLLAVVTLLAASLLLRSWPDHGMMLYRAPSSQTSSLYTLQKLKREPLCQSCNCSSIGSYALSSEFEKLPSFQRLSSQRITRAEFGRYLAHKAFTIGQNDAYSLPDSSRLRMQQNFLSCPDSLFSFNFDALQPKRPTAYVFTRTSGYGRLGAPEKRLRYLRRHAATLADYEILAEKEGHLDGKGAGERQILWIIIEDDDHVSPEIAAWLQTTGLNYLYLAHGPTKFVGLAQWNLVHNLVIWLRDEFLADGPILSVDDDAKVEPELFRRIWKVKKAIVWQVGNMPNTLQAYNSTWEGPLMVQGKVAEWRNSWSWGPKRTFPIDMGGFAVNSSLFGKERQIPGPVFVPFKQYGATSGGGVDTSTENEYLEQIYQKQGDIELACFDTREESCFWAYHNHWLPEDIDGEHPAPLGPDTF